VTEVTGARDAWIARANGVLGEVRRMLAGHGITVDPAVRVVADTHPCPGYVHDTLTIGLCPPVVETRVDALRWTFFSKAMGVPNVEAAARFFDTALPFIVAHEVSHHLRMRGGRHDPSHFVEEQACDKLAAAIVEALPAHRASLGPLREACEAMRDVLARSFAEGPVGAFMPDATDVAADDETTRERLAALRAITAREGLSFAALALLVPALAEGRIERAEAARAEARRHLDLHYARDPAEYWFASVVWLSRYLGAPGRPSLAEVLDLHLLGDAGNDAETIDALTFALRGPDAVVAEGAAAALLARFGSDIVHDLVDETEREPTHREAIVRALARAWEPGWDRRAVARLTRVGVDVGALRHLLRLTRAAGIDPGPLLPAARARAHDDALLHAELVALEGSADDVRAALGGEATDAVLEAMAAHGRLVEGAPPADLPARGTARWEGLLGVLVTPRAGALRADTGSLRAACFAADLAHVEAHDAPNVVERARATVTHASLASALKARCPAGEAGDLARAVLSHAAREAALDVTLALTPRRHRVSKAALLPTVLRPGPLPDVLVELLVADLAPTGGPAAPNALVALLREDAPLPPMEDLRAGAELLGAVARAAVTRALPEMFPDEPEDTAMATLLDRMLHLRRVSLFSALSAERLADLAHVTLERRYASGETIVRAGERGDELYLLVEGEVRLERTSGAPLAVLRPPAFFGEMTLFDEQPRSATAIAATPCFLYSIDGDAVRRVGRRHPEVYEGLLALLSHRLRATTAHVPEGPL